MPTSLAIESEDIRLLREGLECLIAVYPNSYDMYDSDDERDESDLEKTKQAVARAKVLVKFLETL